MRVALVTGEYPTPVGADPCSTPFPFARVADRFGVRGENQVARGWPAFAAAGMGTCPRHAGPGAADGPKRLPGL